MEKLNPSKYEKYLPQGLLEHLRADQVQDAGIDYITPRIVPLSGPRASDRPIRDFISSVRLPARISNPLIPYPQNIKDHVKVLSTGKLVNVHQHHSHHLQKVIDMVRKMNEGWGITGAEVSTEINDLKLLVKGKFSHRDDMIHQSAVAYAKRATNQELSLMALKDVKATLAAHTSSPYISLLVAIHRLRVYIARANEQTVVDYDWKPLICNEPEFKLLKDFRYVYAAQHNSYTSIICASGGHFAIYTSEQNKWFVGPITYLDYMFTVADILNNLTVIMMVKEYDWVIEFCQVLIDLINPKYDHNTCVNFMKSLEGFLLMMSDYDEKFAMNWKPILDVGYTMWELDQKLSDVKYDFDIVIMAISRPKLAVPKGSILCRIIQIAQKMTRNQLQEASSLHKFIYYAEVNAKAGVMKFLKRVHTPRPVDKDAVKEITRLAKQEFYISYVKKHKSSPNLEGNASKISNLKMHAHRKEFNQIKAFPLSWWDEVTIFDCMDNTLTDDALEFAKDKGALKKEIRFGPGDSRKELLQLIESPDYKLKDFFAEGPFVPKAPAVYSTYKRSEAYNSAHPARLIEKEREQKEEARLFANGELSDKHALSVVATKMKKALSYFDEQLMTPSDKQRKSLLHRAAQSLDGTDNYSLLLDIEGHNQSMQASNTSELAEFCGNLFGQRGWGTLPDYFSVLDVYHYDEYCDEVTLSNGQLGGIEGWLNPLWTMHTMLCMKLIRYMTSVDLVTSMTYSDDVNAIIKMPQATEATVQSTFESIMTHFMKFGMIVKMSQTNMSKHRVTMLRQHYADGVRSDSTLKKLISTSGANNSVLMADSLEVAGICSSISSSLEMSNHLTTCIYLKNYKLGILLARLPHMLLARPSEKSMLSSEELPPKLAATLYQIKDDKSYLLGPGFQKAMQGVKNDIAAYLQRPAGALDTRTFEEVMKETLRVPVAEEKYVDGPDRLLYLQMYDTFLQDLLFFLIHMPESVGGLGGSLAINLVLSGHSSGMSKSLHYLKEWITRYSCNSEYFLKYLNTTLTIDLSVEANLEEGRILSSYWPSDIKITSATTSISSAIKSMIRFRARNKTVLNLMKLEDEGPKLREEILNIFRKNYHQRIAQFYYENTSVHFLDLLVNKIETSSGLLTAVRSISRLRNSLCSRALENIRKASIERVILHPWISADSDMIDCLLHRRQKMFPNLKMIMVDEPLYDDKLVESARYPSLFTVRQCSPMHFEGGRKVYDDPDLGNEIRYKGELLDDDRMIGNKEELIAARLVAVTKWILTKYGLTNLNREDMNKLDCIMACNLSLSTLTGQTIMDLWNYSPNETGGEILHRIPNMRFNSTTYIRSDMNRALGYTIDMNQFLITERQWVDSNINFDYVRLRLLLVAMIRDLTTEEVRFKMEWDFSRANTFEDVQFVKPIMSEHVIKTEFICYGKLRNHTFSQLRYRYLATYYLSVDEQNELALIPNLNESESSLKLGSEMIEELIYCYANSLDREYMRVMPDTIDYPLWIPLTKKIESLDSEFAQLTEVKQVEYLQDHLVHALNTRRKVTIVASSDKLKLSIQHQCLTYLEHYRPKDVYHTAMVKRYADLFKSRRGSNALNKLNARYQNILNEHQYYKERLAMVLICEYVLSYHFKTKRFDTDLAFAPKESFQEFEMGGFGRISASFLTPELMIQIMIIGSEFIERVTMTKRDELLQILDEIAQDNHLADVIAPEILPNLKPQTTLTGDEQLTSIAKSVYYEGHRLPYSAMATFNQAKPLFSYARKCADLGADPRVLESVTGSDSYVAQYGLWNRLKQEHDLPEDMRICDLTAGRGDFRYVSRELGLDSDSYAITDTFTRVMFHPEVRHDLKYDLTDMKSLKFVTNYEWVHVDVSFTGKDSLNIVDLILYLEENNIAYSIRVNSVELQNYQGKILEGLPYYDHYLYSPSNSTLKPYQMYLVGLPSTKQITNEALEMKQTTAFRVIALAYSRLLSPANRLLKLDEKIPNSANIYLGAIGEIRTLMQEICNRSSVTQEEYYLGRYLAEVLPGDKIFFVPELCEKDELPRILAHHSDIGTGTGSRYYDSSPDSIGKVSESSRPFHVKHLHALQDPNHQKSFVECINASGPILEYFRARHPLAHVRAQCNTVLGMKSFVNPADQTTDAHLERRYTKVRSEKKPRNTLHQQEYQSALKLLLLSANYGDYMWGVRYCHIFIGRGKHNQKFYTTILKLYRQLSYLYTDCTSMIRTGSITIKDIKSLRHEMVDVIEKKMRYKKATDLSVELIPEPLLGVDAIEINFDQLFTDLESYANQEHDKMYDDGGGLIALDHAGDIQMEFSIDIEERIEAFIANTSGLNVNQFGQIDLGDDMDDIDFDLM
jgi:hypothetical protein